MFRRRRGKKVKRHGRDEKHFQGGGTRIFFKKKKNTRAGDGVFVRFALIWLYRTGTMESGPPPLAVC